MYPLTTTLTQEEASKLEALLTYHGIKIEEIYDPLFSQGVRQFRIDVLLLDEELDRVIPAYNADAALYHWEQASMADVIAKEFGPEYLDIIHKLI